MSGVSGDFPVQLTTRLPDWSAGALMQCIVLSVCPCVVSFFKFDEPDTRDILARILVASSSDTSDTPGFLVTCHRHPRKYATRTQRGNCLRAI